MLMTLARVVIAALLAVSGLVLATSAPAFACTCAPGTIAAKADRVDAVFVAEVDGVTEVGARFVYAVTATHAYQGTVEREVTVETRQQTSACGLGELENGTDYVFFANGDGAYEATSCDGSGPATDKRIVEVEDVLGDGTGIEEPPPPAPVMTKVEDSAPASAERLAAPGGALVLVGLLGLLVVGRLARR